MVATMWRIIPKQIQKWKSFEAGAPQFEQAGAGRYAKALLKTGLDNARSKSGDVGFENFPLLSLFRYIMLMFLFSSCAERHFSSDQFPHHDNGTAKPRVAIVPVITTKASDVPWNLSEELTEIISEKFAETKQFFLTSDFSVLRNYLTDLSEINPLIEDLRWLYENGSSSEFVIFVELVEHLLIPKDGSKLLPKAYTLHMAFRTHVIDIRAATPKVILQELVQESFPISLKLDYSKSLVNKTAFFLSPLGLAHSHMVKKTTKQIQDYILLNI